MSERVPSRVFLKPIKENDIRTIVEGDVSHPMNTNPSFDLIEEWAEDDTEFREEMIRTFIEEIPVQLAEARTAFGKGSSPAIAEKLHAMQTKIRTFGLHEISAFVDALENQARSEEIRDADHFASELNQLENALKKTIKKLIQELTT